MKISMFLSSMLLIANAALPSNSIVELAAAGSVIVTVGLFLKYMKDQQSANHEERRATATAFAERLSEITTECHEFQQAQTDSVKAALVESAQASRENTEALIRTNAALERIDNAS